MGRRVEVQPGERFGRLAVVREVPRRRGKRYFLCVCDCGTEREFRFVSLRAGVIKSCGCLRNEQNRNAGLTHGLWGSGLYWTWHSMKQRCLNSRVSAYDHYGGRGISVCPEWLDFEPFHAWAMANGYQEGLTIERINNDGSYEPANCRWATQREQLLNTRRSRRITFGGRTQTLKEWADVLGFEYHVLRGRLARGWSVRRAFTTPLQLWASRRVR